MATACLLSRMEILCSEDACILLVYLFSFSSVDYFVGGGKSYCLRMSDRIPKLAYSLLMPYFLYHSYLLVKWGMNSQYASSDLIRILTVNMSPNPPCWFFFAFFVVKLVCDSIQNRLRALILVLFIYFLIYGLGVRLGILFCSHAIVAGCIFYLMGSCSYWMLSINSKLKCVLFVVALSVVLLYIPCGVEFDMYLGNIDNPATYIIVSLASVICILLVSQFFASILPMDKLGYMLPLSRGTMLIVGTHYPIVRYLSSHFFVDYPWIEIKIMVSLIFLFVYWVVIRLTYKNIPFLYGKKNK